MDVSILTAKIAGVIYLAVGVGMLVNTKHYHKLITKWYKDIHFTYLGGFMAIIAGVLLTSYHNIWVKDWTVIITIIGWAALIKGILLVIAPEKLGKMGKSLFKKQESVTYIGGLIIILGLVLCYFSYGNALDTNALISALQ